MRIENNENGLTFELLKAASNLIARGKARLLNESFLFMHFQESHVPGGLALATQSSNLSFLTGTKRS